MLRYVPFEQIGARHIEGLVKSLNAAPECARPDAKEWLADIQAGRKTLFEWDEGIAVCGARPPRLVLFACSTTDLIHTILPFVEDLKRIAAEWQCDTIETIVFDPRLASCIKKLGGALESQLMTLPVE